MAGDVGKAKNLIFFYHKNHNDKFNGTSVYDKAMLNVLRAGCSITVVEPGLGEVKARGNNKSGTHYFINLVKQVYIRQIKWLINILGGNHLTSPENTILLVEDIYSAPVPLLVSKLKGYKLVFRVADFGLTYSKTLFDRHPFDSFVYSVFRRIMERLMVTNSSLIICPSKSVASSLINNHPFALNKVVFLPYVRTKSSVSTSDQDVGNAIKDHENKILLLFMGDFRYPPNCTAGNYVVNELIPKLNGHSGDYEILIAGQNSQRFYSDSPNVKVLGAVEDIDALLSKVHIGLAPMRTVGGLSMKVVDYLVHGLRVVATPEAANGIELNPQMKVTSLEDFDKIVEQEINGAMDKQHVDHWVSPEVERTFMSQEWEKNLLTRVTDLFSNEDNSATT